MLATEITEGTEIDDIIRELTFVGADSKRVCLAADIGNAGIDEVEWKFLSGGRFTEITMPRVAFTYQREPRRNFWLVEMAERVAAIYGIDDLVLSESEAAAHRERILATNCTN